MTGYPGLLASTDDFSATSQRLLVSETTNPIYNASLYDLISPYSVPIWVRSIAANRLASSGREWHDIFYKFNSGTYSNQWIVVDYKLFVPGQPLQPWTLTVSEQLPDPYAHAAEDMTDVLQFGHWASYNVPFFPDVYKVAGYPELEKRHGIGQTYQQAPRAKIFRREANLVSDLQAAQALIRWNGFTVDPLAPTADAAVSSRGDLLAGTAAAASGAIDGKVVSKALMESLTISAVSGPSRGFGQLPAFAFSGNWSSTPHFGITERPFDFGWYTFSPAALAAEAVECASVPCYT